LRPSAATIVMGVRQHNSTHFLQRINSITLIQRHSTQVRISELQGCRKALSERIQETL
jgi:hypothetical protein